MECYLPFFPLALALSCVCWPNCFSCCCCFFTIRVVRSFVWCLLSPRPGQCMLLVPLHSSIRASAIETPLTLHACISLCVVDSEIFSYNNTLSILFLSLSARVHNKHEKCQHLTPMRHWFWLSHATCLCECISDDICTIFVFHRIRRAIETELCLVPIVSRTAAFAAIVLHM